jgi:hypothetical protein
MGSIAMDQSGNIALGYSVSSGSINPGLRFTGRVPTDTLGTMEAESTIKTGTGSQLSNLNRWGDYSSMSVDPVDDCTFWYTNEYLKANGTFNWSTWIASFKFSGCGSTTPVHDVAVASVTAPSPVVVNNAQTVSATVQNLGTQPESFAVSLSDSLASNITITPQTISLGAGASQILTFTWTPTVTSTHSLTATASLSSDTNTANNSSQTTSTVNAVSSGPPTITSISPTTAKAGITTPFTINGVNFVAGATVTFQSGTGPAPNASAITVNGTGTTITATVKVPSGGPPRSRVWDVKVTNPNGQSAVLPQAFTVNP